MAEAAPAYGGQRMARDLARAGLQTTAIPDSAIFAMMARVNKARGGAARLRLARAAGRAARPVQRPSACGRASKPPFLGYGKFFLSKRQGIMESCVL